MTKQTNRIDELEKEVKLFQEEIAKRQQAIQNLNNEILQLAQGVQTRQGGIIELKRLEEEKSLKKEKNAKGNNV